MFYRDTITIIMDQIMSTPYLEFLDPLEPVYILIPGHLSMDT